MGIVSPSGSENGVTERIETGIGSGYNNISERKMEVAVCLM